VHAAVIAGLGFAALPRLAVAADIASGVLKSLPLPPIARPITAVRRRRQGGPALEDFWRLVARRGSAGNEAEAALSS
jgi:DNA-binding transcriptional LysR family regulator